MNIKYHFITKDHVCRPKMFNCCHSLCIYIQNFLNEIKLAACLIVSCWLYDKNEIGRMIWIMIIIRVWIMLRRAKISIHRYNKIQLRKSYWNLFTNPKLPFSDTIVNAYILMICKLHHCAASSFVPLMHKSSPGEVKCNKVYLINTILLLFFFRNCWYLCAHKKSWCTNVLRVLM
jgi:hypothetical protein